MTVRSKVITVHNIISKIGLIYYPERYNTFMKKIRVLVNQKSAIINRGNT